tara:strand:- start:156 stop:410 length:255 start_codon:yes stop_codon:yes gene_type:complete
MKGIDAKEVATRMLKYFVEGLVVAVAAWVMPGKKSDPVDVICLGLVAAATFSLLDLFAPSVAVSARSGAGMGVGANLVGFPTRR